MLFGGLFALGGLSLSGSLGSGGLGGLLCLALGGSGLELLLLGNALCLLLGGNLVSGGLLQPCEQPSWSRWPPASSARA